MGVAGLFFGNLGAVSTSVKLQDLERIGDMSIGALDASIMMHDVACRVDPVATIEGNFTPFVDEYLKRLYMLIKFKMLVVVVFDGEKNPRKVSEDSRRDALRAQGLADYTELKGKLAAGVQQSEEEQLLLHTQMEKAARAAFRRTPELQAALQERLTHAGFRWIAAPFEADSQLAWLARMGRVEYILSEDADMVVLGCPRVLTKLDLKTGWAVLVRSDEIFTVKSLDEKDVPSTVSGRGERGLMLLASLAGSDYCNIKGVRLQIAALIMRHMPRGSADPSDVPAAARSAGVCRLIPDDAVERLQEGVKGYSLAVATRLDTECKPVRMEPAVAMQVVRQKPAISRLLRLPCIVLPAQPEAAPQFGPPRRRPVFKTSKTIKLTIEMVPGAVLPPVEEWRPLGRPTVAELQAFARSRGFTGFTGQSKERLAKRCREHLACEKERGGPISLRAPHDGLTLVKGMEEWDIARCENLINGVYKSPPLAGYFTLTEEADQLLAALPFFETSIIKQIFNEKRLAQSGKTRIEIQGFQRLAAKELKSFALHPPKLLEGGVNACWVRCLIPASMVKEKARKQREEGDEVVTEAMRRKHYEVVLALEVSGEYVIGLLESRCPCIAGRALCVHVAALCQAHHYLKERERLLQVKDGRICTSELCQWLIPAQPAAEELQRRPLRELSCFAADPENIFKSKSSLPCHGRSVVEPSIFAKPELKRGFFDPSRVAAREKLWESLSNANVIRCKKKRRQDEDLPPVSMKSMYQLNWGNEVATEQKRSDLQMSQ